MEFEKLMNLIQTVNDSPATDFVYEQDGMKLMIKKENQKTIVSERQEEAPAVPVKSQKSGKIICSPLVGRFYAAPAEDASPYVQVGDVVRKGQTIGIIEAMKLMNEIECEYDGRIAEILVKNGDVIEYGQNLFCIEEV